MIMVEACMSHFKAVLLNINIMIMLKNTARELFNKQSSWPKHNIIDLSCFSIGSNGGKLIKKDKRCTVVF